MSRVLDSPIGEPRGRKDRAVKDSDNLNDTSSQPVRCLSPIFETFDGPADLTAAEGFSGVPADPLGYFVKGKPVRNDDREGY